MLPALMQEATLYMFTKKKAPVSYLRTHRRNWGLTQNELAGLIGTVSALQISRYENGKRDPALGVALACQAIFGVAPSTMFPTTYALSEEGVMRNMYRMDKALENTTSLSGIRKRELCSMALHRAINHPPV
jgi:transcriptional regulator with XRE-family HTH domain